MLHALQPKEKIASKFHHRYSGLNAKTNAQRNRISYSRPFLAEGLKNKNKTRQEKRLDKVTKGIIVESQFPEILLAVLALPPLDVFCARWRREEG